MPRIVFTANATANLAELVAFLRQKSPLAAVRAVSRIRQGLGILVHQPQIGVPVPDQPYQRNLPISFGAAGYVARYRYHPDGGEVVVLAIRHTRQAGYTGLET